MNERVYGLLGLAMRAGKLAVGREKSLKLIRQGRAHLVILAEDASRNTKKDFYDKGKYYSVPVLEKGSMDRLGQALGKGPRSVVAVGDGALARNIMKKWESREGSDSM